MKQLAVANQMHITQQAYSHLETKSANVKVGTLYRLCAVIKVDPAFLLAHDIAITAENMVLFDMHNYAALFHDYQRLKKKAVTMEELIFNINARNVVQA